MEGQTNLIIKGKKYLVKCKFCGLQQKCIVYAPYPVGHSHKCVSCGKKFVIHSNVNNSCIIKEIYE
jgi:transposase-like protein